MKLDAVAVTKHCCHLAEIIALAKEAFPPEEYLSPHMLLEMLEAGEEDDFDCGTFKGLMLSLRIEGFHPHFFTRP